MWWRIVTVHGIRTRRSLHRAAIACRSSSSGRPCSRWVRSPCRSPPASRSSSWGPGPSSGRSCTAGTAGCGGSTGRRPRPSAPSTGSSTGSTRGSPGCRPSGTSAGATGPRPRLVAALHRPRGRPRFRAAGPGGRGARRGAVPGAALGRVRRRLRRHPHPAPAGAAAASRPRTGHGPAGGGAAVRSLRLLRDARAHRRVRRHRPPLAPAPDRRGRPPSASPSPSGSRLRPTSPPAPPRATSGCSRDVPRGNPCCCAARSRPARPSGRSAAWTPPPASTCRRPPGVGEPVPEVGASLPGCATS